jgi:hypothetical protein
MSSWSSCSLTYTWLHVSSPDTCFASSCTMPDTCRRARRALSTLVHRKHLRCSVPSILMHPTPTHLLCPGATRGDQATCCICGSPHTICPHLGHRVHAGHSRLARGALDAHGRLLSSQVLLVQGHACV